MFVDEAATRRAARAAEQQPKKRQATMMGLRQPPQKKKKNKESRDTAIEWIEGRHYKLCSLDAMPAFVEYRQPKSKDKGRKGKGKDKSKDTDSDSDSDGELDSSEGAKKPPSKHAWVCLCPVGKDGANGKQKLCHVALRVPVNKDGSERKPNFPRHFRVHFEHADPEHVVAAKLWVQLQLRQAAATAKRDLVHGPFDNDELEVRILNLLVQGEYPFETVASEAFKEMLNYLQPLAGTMVKSPKTYHRRTLATLGALTSEQCEELSCLPDRSVSIGGDIWSDRRGRSILAVTARYITADFQARNLVLAVLPMSGQKLAPVIKEKFVEVMNAHGGTGKFLSACTDGASNMVGRNSIGAMPDTVHVHCGAHVGNLLAGILCDSVRAALDAAVSLVKYWNRHPDERHSVLRANDMAIIPQVAAPVPTRWSSTYDTLAVLIRYRSSFELLANPAALRREIDHALTDEQWQELNELYDHLSLINPMLKVLQREDVVLGHAITLFMDLCSKLDARETVQQLLMLSDSVPPDDDELEAEPKLKSKPQPWSGDESSDDDDGISAARASTSRTSRSRASTTVRRSGRETNLPRYLEAAYAIFGDDSDADEDAARPAVQDGAPVGSSTDGSPEDLPRSLSLDPVWVEARRKTVRKAFQRFGRHLRLQEDDVLLNFFLTPLNKDRSWPDFFARDITSVLGPKDGEQVAQWYKNKYDDAMTVLTTSLMERARTTPTDGAVATATGYGAPASTSFSEFLLIRQHQQPQVAEELRRAAAHTSILAWQSMQLLAGGAGQREVDDLTQNPLKWWREHHGHPAAIAIAPVARRVLAIDASSAASERVFSTGGRLHTPARNRLDSMTLAALMMLKHADLMRFKDCRLV